MKTWAMQKLMGKLVVVEKVIKLRTEYVSSTHRYERTVEAEDITLRAGWIVGFRMAQPGTIVTDEGSNSFIPKRGCGVRVLLVAFWPTEKPVMVPLGGWQESVGILQPYSRQGTGLNDLPGLSAAMKAEMKDWPRSETTGRWLKKSRTP